MKKCFVFLLMVGLFPVLAACGNQAEAPTTAATTQATTLPAETAESTQATVETTQATTEATTVPTEATTEPTQPETTKSTEAVHTHSYSQTVIPATCTAPGTTYFVCDCGDNFTEGKTPPQGHSYGDWVMVKLPTATEAGLEERTCADCGEKEQNYLPANP